jgi:hypothetical protein
MAAAQSCSAARRPPGYRPSTLRPTGQAGQPRDSTRVLLMARRSRKSVQEDAVQVDSVAAANLGKKPASEQQYLAAELGHQVDQEGEPLGLDFPLLRRDAEFREFTLSLWRQFQATRTISSQARELEQEGLSNADLWEPGITEFLPTSSTPEQLRRYKQKLLFRASFLEAVLTETIGELKKLDRAKPLLADNKKE